MSGRFQPAISRSDISSQRPQMGYVLPSSHMLPDPVVTRDSRQPKRVERSIRRGWLRPRQRDSGMLYVLATLFKCARNDMADIKTVVTTHGVGELSALNGISGAMSENVKVIHVVGQTTRAMQKNHMMIHHSIGNKPDHQVSSTIPHISLQHPSEPKLTRHVRSTIVPQKSSASPPPSFGMSIRRPRRLTA